MLEEREARTWGMACHLSALAGFVIPFGSIIGPLVVWLIKREESGFVDRQGKEALNFQITMFIAFLISLVLMFVLIGFVLIAAVVIFDLIMIIVATIKTSEGQDFRYPVSLRLIA